MSSGSRPSSFLHLAWMLLSVVAFLVMLGLFVWAIGSSLYQVGRQSLDVWPRAAWMVQHFSDPEVFPPKAEICAAPFCRSANTQPTRVGGNPGHRSETMMPFCHDHPPLLPSYSSRFDDLLRFTYWVLAMALSLAEAAVVVVILCSPLMLLRTWLVRQDAGLHGMAGKLGSSLEMIMTGFLCLTFIAWLLAWIMFAWW